MKTNLCIIRWLTLAALFISNLQSSTTFAQGTTAFTYQGQLRDGGTNANGTYTMIFALYDSASAGNQIGSTITTNSTLANGLFTVNLDFGAEFNGSARWLDITVQSGSDSEELTPRVQVLPAPYAQFAAVAATVTNGAIMNAQLAGYAVATTNIQNGAVTTAQIANGAVTNRNLAANAVAATNMILDSAGLARVTGGAASVTGNPLGTGNTVEFNTGLLTLAFSGTGGSSIWDIANGYSVVLGFPGTLVNNLYFYGDSSGFPAAQIWDQPASGTRGISALNVIANTLSTSNIIGNPTFSGNPLFTGNIGLQQGTAGTTLWNVNVGSASGPASYSFNNALVFSANGVPCLAMVGVTPTGSAVWAYSQLGALEVDCGEMNVRDPSTWNSVVHIDSSGNITAAGDINSPTINDIYTQIVNLQEEIDALGSDSESVQSQVISDQNLNAKDAEIQKLKSQNASFEKRLAALEALVKASAHK